MGSSSEHSVRACESPPIRIAVLGSTGSVGLSTLEVVRHYPGRFKVTALAAHSNIDLLARQITEFNPEYVAVVDEQSAKTLETQLGGTTAVWAGKEGLERLAAIPVDATLCAIVGAAGLAPLLGALDAGNRIALANKESLVMAGALVMDRARTRNVPILPVDSEHNAIFQCLEGHPTEHVHCIHLTASGGPFYNRSRDALSAVTPAEATAHPTWDMGDKISVDSATLMNKGLEVIEAMWLFNLPLERIKVVIHPQSIVHGLVEFNDGGILAHMGITDMRFPIVFALTWPERVQSPMGRLDLATMGSLTFAEPDFSAFPCLALALEAAAQGGTATTTLNAANEIAVEAFCAGRIGFLQIAALVEKVLNVCPAAADVSLEAVLAADAEARRKALELIDTVGS